VTSSAFPGCGIAGGIVLDANDKPFSWSQSCFDNVPRVLASLVRDHHPRVIAWFSSWELSDRLDLATNTVLKLGTPAHDAALLASIDAAVHILTADGAKVVLLTLPPRAPNDNVGRPADAPGGPTVHYNALLSQYARQHRDVASVVDLSEFVCPGGAPCARIVHGVQLRGTDGAHFTRATAPVVGRWLLPQLRAIAGH
jgi:hypothetical protein